MKELAFRTNARHIGQLGRELVTDFVTALVELIKNSYDADAESARVSILDTKNSLGKILVADTGTGMSIDDFENKWMVIGTSNKLAAPYTSKGRKKAGKKGIGRFSVERLAERVEIYSFPESGSAFSVKINWNRYEELDIAAIQQRIEILEQHNDREAAKFISSQIQYALLLDVMNQADQKTIKDAIVGDVKDYRSFHNASNLHRLKEVILPVITKYDGYHQLMEEVRMPLTLIDDLNSCPAYGTLKELCKTTGKDRVSGTVMVLEGLRDEWNQRSIDRLQKELRLLVAPNFLDEDPFDICLVAPEFKVDDLLSANDIVHTSYAKVEASISNNGRTGKVRYTDITGIVKSREHTYETPLLCGDLNFELYYFLRDSEHLKVDGYNYRFAIKVLDTYCGIKIYRDKFRVKPYGEPGNDWLYLDKEKVKDTHGYLVGNNQTIGRINISDQKNPLLVDATNREGIIENAAYEQMRDFIQDCIGIISEVRKEVYESAENRRRELEREKEKLEHEKETLQKKTDAISSALAQIEDIAKSPEIPAGMVTLLTDFSDKVREHTSKQHEYQQKYEKNAEERVETLQQSLDYAVSELTMYKNLASLGMLAGEFGHETSDVINRIRNAVQAVIRAIRNDPSLSKSVALLDIVKNDFRRIASYSDMIIAFLRKKKRDKAENLSLSAVITEIGSFYKDILDEFGIELNYAFDESITVNMRQIDLESMIINLITNAYAQLKTCANRKICVSTWRDREDINIRVEDSGHGVPPEDREKIFTAFVTSKDDGIGLGLNIVRDIVKSYGGNILCEESPLYGGACFTISFVERNDDNV